MFPFLRGIIIVDFDVSFFSLALLESSFLILSLPSNDKQERQTSREGSLAPCSFRVSSEGLPLILPYITKQILYASLVDFKHLLQYKSIKYADFVDAEFGNKASELMPGCCVVVLRKGMDHHAIKEQ